MRARVIMLMVAALVAAGCAAGPPPAASPPARPSGASTGAGVNGCGRGPGLEAGRHVLSHGGLRRRFLLALPEGGGPHPVILDLHGLGSGAVQQRAYSRLAEQGTRRGYVVATPQAADGRLGWTLPRTGGPDDTAFLAALLDHLRRTLCVDARRQFAAGMSYGAAMAVSLVCALDGRLSAVAAVAGLNIVRPCQDAPPTTIVAFHGTGDQVVPYEGGHPLRSAPGDLRALGRLVTLEPVERAAAAWAARLGCTGRATARPAGNVRLQRWRTCPGRATLALYTVEGGGHTWPGSADVPRLGPVTRDLDATAVILNAFDRAPSR
ncbi:hypothetical protein E1286_08110 [Nonomuraea terrae]|uniref:Polyhydroxybutyrate depolymerase n=1 Tax=Nonomuraea terrae TaxID=2530383 RepID=A0A4R4Z4L5_9ACTN|nr:hypothetical protein [Nonomuraea terrae]TDD53008.1 hypothetical protein E1286_08110 [Nonomuraea terrae]